jgi:hypothetical protein
MAADVIESDPEFYDTLMGISFDLAPYCIGCAEISPIVDSVTHHANAAVVSSRHRITCANAYKCARLKARFEKGATT